MPGPYFPTAALIIGKQAAWGAIARGRGSIWTAARAPMSKKSARTAKPSSLPRFPIRRTRLGRQQKIAELVRDKRIDGISDIRDESDRDGMRVVIELRRDAQSDVVLNQLDRFSDLQTQLRRLHMLASASVARPSC